MDYGQARDTRLRLTSRCEYLGHPQFEFIESGSDGLTDRDKSRQKKEGMVIQKLTPDSPSRCVRGVWPGFPRIAFASSSDQSAMQPFLMAIS
jgi:hypothetical protein